MTHKIAIQLHQVAGSCTICSCHARRTVRKLLDTSSSTLQHDSQSPSPDQFTGVSTCRHKVHASGIWTSRNYVRDAV